MPLKAEEYERLTHAGLNGVICFQETYNKANYNIYHPRGMKSKFEWRVNGFDRMGQAGVHKIGGRTDRTGGMENGYHHDGLSSPLLAEALLENEI